MLAMNQSSIGVLSLRSGYEEGDILRSVPWEKVNISLITIPVTHYVDRGAAVRNTLEENGFKIVAMAMNKFDIVAVNKNVLKMELAKSNKSSTKWISKQESQIIYFRLKMVALFSNNVQFMVDGIFYHIW